MSRISHLPPRCPLTRVNEDDMHDLIRFPSLDTILEEQPHWFDDLLKDSNVNPKGNVLRRSVSDPLVILDVSDNLQCPICDIDVTKSVETGEGSESYNGFKGNCVYGPNSPRRKSNLTNSEVSALMGSIPPNKLQYVTVDFPTCDATKQEDVHRGFQISAGDLDPEKVARRRSGQRSRVRKLQYIAELERIVEAYQTWGAELADGVASLFQQRVALSAENKNLRRQIAGLQQEKMIKDVQYQYLRNEAERLKVIYGHSQHHRRSKSTPETDPLGASWQMLDFGNLSLGANPVPLRQG